MTALILPGLETDAVWQTRTRSDAAARALADRHYSRGTIGAPTVGPPGRVLVLVTPCERAAWITHWPQPDLTLDGLDAWRCTMFRNEGAGLSSHLIRAAMAATLERWCVPPPSGWVTFVDRRHVKSANPGYCFRCAGWRTDHAWTPRRPTHLIRMRADA